MTRLFKVLGFDEGVQVCDCCGKGGLKGTYGIEMIETGEILYYGSVCVTRNTGHPKKEINAFAKADLEERVKLARAEYRATPEYAASVAKFTEARKLGVSPGVAHRDFVKEAADADHAVQIAIANKFRVPTYLM